ncbi:cytochrome P450 [Xylariomycetidae sp. FL2044]|nr:cytochrome P450 [Xylariomycetidae sp. FL2044]
MSYTALICGSIGILAGLGAHQLFYIRGERHTDAPTLFLCHTVFLTVLLSPYIFPMPLEISHAIGLLTMAGLAYGCALLLSIVIYRFTFHRLSQMRFPGPWYARITKLWHVWVVRESKNHLVLDKLHKQYGDFVRTGPGEITVFHPAIWKAVDGPGARCVKSEWYDIMYPGKNLVTARDKTVHTARRREWNRGFTASALTGHRAKILVQIDKLDQCIESHALAGQPTEARDVFLWFGFDAMGDFVLSKSFNMLQDRKWHDIIVHLRRALSLLGPLTPTPWLMQIALRSALIPHIGPLRDWFDMFVWGETEVRNRLQNGIPAGVSPDLTHYLMEEKGESGDQMRLLWLRGDSLLAIIAGSEPTAVTLIYLFCFLAIYPSHADAIYCELQSPGVDVGDEKSLGRLKHLNAVIKETQRLCPALLTGGSRKTLDEGIWVGDTYIPAETTIYAPRFSIFRREDCFERANEFIPERWTTRPEMLRNVEAFAPFGTGHHSCVGRPLATEILRLTVARLISRYTFSFAPGESGNRVFDDTCDQFTTNPGALTLCFKLRE